MGGGRELFFLPPTFLSQTLFINQISDLILENLPPTLPLAPHIFGPMKVGIAYHLDAELFIES